jgi:hypothetical protein
LTIKPILLFLLFEIIVQGISAQPVNVTGKVVDKGTKHPVENAAILVYNKKSVVFNGISDSAGMFKIPVVLYRKASTIRIHVFSYSDLEIDHFPEIDTTQKRDYFLGVYSIKPQSSELKEVVVKSTRRYSDTSRIDLSKEKFERSVMIDGIFSANYGFSRDASGQLYYKGKPVSIVSVNGGDFFGKNNMDIYRLLPALVLDNIRVVETNIDSVTNATLLKPVIKINLSFKEQYKNGKFGNLNLGAGTSQRYLANTNLFAYKDREQVSLSLNSNNVNVTGNTLQPPNVSFAANGNNLTANGGKVTYRNVYSGKLELDLSVAGRSDSKSNSSETDLQQEPTNLTSHTFNSSTIRSFNIDDSRLGIRYKIDSLNSVNIAQTFGHSTIREDDSLNYSIQFDSLTTTSQLSKTRMNNSDLLSTRMEYQKKSPDKRGRMLDIDVELTNNHYGANEFDKAADLAAQGLTKYFITGNHGVKENTYAINASFTEPIHTYGYIKFYVSQKRETLNYTTKVNSDTTIIDPDEPALLTNYYYQSGIKFKRTLDNISIDATISGVLEQRNIQQPHGNSIAFFMNPDLALSIYYKFNKNRNLIIDITDVTNYPQIQQLVALNSTFDLLSQTSGNIYLKPEKREGIKIDYSTKSFHSDFITVSGEFEHFYDKFGSVIDYSANTLTQNVFTGNLGSSNGGKISFSYLKNIAGDQYINSSSGFSYQQNPTVLNDKLSRDNSISFSQSISGTVTLIKPLLSVKPLIAFSWVRYFYGSRAVNITTITNSDEVSFRFKTFELNLYPLFNYNYNVSANSSFSTNGALKKSIFKNYGSIWIQAYDIFNSFKFYNNYVGPAGHQSVKYSNLQRYLMVGVSLQFNNMK